MNVNMLNDKVKSHIKNVFKNCADHIKNVDIKNFHDLDEESQALVLLEQAYVLLYSCVKEVFEKPDDIYVAYLPDWSSITLDDRRHLGVVAAVSANHYKEMVSMYEDLDSMPENDAAMFAFDGAYLQLYKWAMENGLPDFGLLNTHKNSMN